jgi:hypothetical protein
MAALSPRVNPSRTSWSVIRVWNNNDPSLVTERNFSQTSSGVGKINEGISLRLVKLCQRTKPPNPERKINPIFLTSSQGFIINRLIP